jgi:hypothetical protein
LGVQENGNRALLSAELSNWIQPPVESQPNPRQGDGHREGERQNHTDRRPLSQENQTLGECVPDHGGHIPS